MQAGHTLGYAPNWVRDREDPGREYVRRHACPAGPYGKCSGLVGLSSEASAKCDSSPFSENLGMDQDKTHSPGQYLNKTCFKFGLKIVVSVLFSIGGINTGILHHSCLKTRL